MSFNRFMLSLNQALFIVNAGLCISSIIDHDYKLAIVYFLCILLNIYGIKTNIKLIRGS